MNSLATTIIGLSAEQWQAVCAAAERTTKSPGQVLAILLQAGFVCTAPEELRNLPDMRGAQYRLVCLSADVWERVLRVALETAQGPSRIAAHLVGKVWPVQGDISNVED